MRRHVSTFGRASLVTAMVLLALAPAASAQQNTTKQAPTCGLTGSLVRVPELPEGSGVALSRQSPGRLWAHNDSGEPALVALDTNGGVAGRVRVSGAKVEDWEAIAVGPCASGDCIDVGDIGDNDAGRSSITSTACLNPRMRPARPLSPMRSGRRIRTARTMSAKAAESQSLEHSAG
jgi:hypothetical protein